MRSKCLFCNAYYFAGGMPSDGQMTLCCNKGTVDVLVLNTDYPRRLRDFMTVNNAIGVVFRRNVILINNSLAMASFSANI